MKFDLSTFLRAVGQSIRSPDVVAAQIKLMRFPHGVLWAALGLAIVLSVLVLHLDLLLPGHPSAAMMLSPQPLIGAIFLGALTTMLIFVLHFAGRAMGGTGTFGATLAMMTWFQWIVLVLLCVQVFAAFISPGLAGVFALASFGIQIWCLVHFTNVLHDFQSLPKTVGLLMLSLIGLSFGLAIIIVLIGGAAMVGGTA